MDAINWHSFFFLLFGAGSPTQAMIEGANGEDVGAAVANGPVPLTPEALVATPDHEHVGYFVGSPGMNLIDGEIRGIQAPVSAEVNEGHTCLKGRFAFQFYDHPDRLREPLIKRNGKFEVATWQ